MDVGQSEKCQGPGPGMLPQKSASTGATTSEYKSRGDIWKNLRTNHYYHHNHTQTYNHYLDDVGHIIDNFNDFNHTDGHFTDNSYKHHVDDNHAFNNDHLQFNPDNNDPDNNDQHNVAHEVPTRLLVLLRPDDAKRIRERPCCNDV